MTHGRLLRQNFISNPYYSSSYFFVFPNSFLKGNLPIVGVITCMVDMIKNYPE